MILIKNSNLLLNISNTLKESNLSNEEVVIEDLESSIETWLLGNREDCIENLGEDICAAVTEELEYE